MTTPKKSEITPFLDDLRQRLKIVETAQANVGQIRADALSLETEIEKLGEPDYRDDKAITKLTHTQIKFKSCEKALAAAEVKLGDAVIGLSELIPAGGEMAALLLQDVYRNRIDGITASLAVFCATKERAKQLAEQTDSAMIARGAIARFFQTKNPLREYGGHYQGERESEEQYQLECSQLADIAVFEAQRVENVLATAVSRSGDMVQFLDTKTQATQPVLTPDHALNSGAKDLPATETNPA